MIPSAMSPPVSMLTKARSSDKEAVAELYLIYSPKILKLIRATIKRPEDVDDVAQDVFLRLRQSIRQLREEKTFDQWLSRLVKNAALDHLRKQRRRSSELRFADLSNEQQHFALSAKCRDRRIERMFSREYDAAQSIWKQLSPPDRKILFLKEIAGYSIDDLAAIYSVTGIALRVRLHRIRQRARKLYRAHPDLQIDHGKKQLFDFAAIDSANPRGARHSRDSLCR